MDLKNAKVLITGGSRGIGFSTAKLLKEHGAKVAITGRTQSDLDAAAKELDALPIQMDVSKEEDCARTVQTVIKEFGSFNVLVNNAAYGYFGPLVDLEREKFDAMMAVNLTGVMLMTREAAKHFIEQNTGNVINISSTAGGKGFAGGTPYVSSKFAMKGMTECWRAELRPHNIRVMQVNPSEVQTTFGASAGYGTRPHSDRKLVGDDIAHAIKSVLEMEDRGFITELTVFATNPD